jgi:glycosyltransferase involved in cell wall biosynthesis
LLLLDDCSTDATPALARQRAAADGRVVYVRNDRRLGLLGSWRRAFELARAQAPGLVYFAWASDHDLWEPDWLRTLVEELEAHPEAVAAYPLSDEISETGVVVARPSGRARALAELDTAGVRSPWRRVWLSSRGMVAGSMVYALFRADALERAGVFRRVLGPDRLLLTELAFAGEFRQPRRVLWHRRFRSLHTRGRQRAGSFPDGAPAYTYLPLTLQHLGAVLGAYVLGRSSPAGSRGRGARFLAWLAAVSAAGGLLEVLRSLRKLVFRTDRPLDRSRKGLARGRKRSARLAKRVRRLAGGIARAAGLR